VPSSNSPITQYNIRYYDTKSKQQVYEATTAQTSFTATNGIIAGHSFMVSVSAQNQVATSLHSESLLVLAASCPSMPQNLQVGVNSNSQQIVLNWDPPASTGCTPVLDYVVWMNRALNGFSIVQSNVA
jgi:hypothetical protein